MRRNGDDTSSPPKTRKRCHSRIKIENTDRSNRWISVAGSLGIFNEHNDAKVPKAQSIKNDVQSNNDTPTRRRKCNGKLVGNVLGIFYEDVDNLDVDGLQFLKHQSKSVKSNQHLAHEHTTIDLKNNPRISCGIPPRLQQLQAQKSSCKLTKVNINTPPRKKVLGESRKNIVSTPTLTDSEAPKTIDYAQGTQEAVIDIDDSDDEEKWKYSSQQSAVPVKYKKALKRPLHMNHVKRINVHSPGAKDMITECRQNGCPIVLRGHNGWVNFAKPWLRSSLVEMINHEDDDIDLWNQNFSIDYNKMIEDIGNEEVPVLDVNYDPNNISESMTSMPLVTFLNCHWRHRKGSAFYLHQWQFPLSETAKPKLCMQSKPLTIFGEDILKYYGIDGDDDDDDDGDINADELKDNVYQYLFMGSTGSKTLLHVDPGGLDMTIAPITGRKECILVHRDDGDCLYGLDAMLDSDVDEYPLLNQARIWKTVIKPGEILLMPQVRFNILLLLFFFI